MDGFRIPKETILIIRKTILHPLVRSAYRASAERWQRL